MNDHKKSETHHIVLKNSVDSWEEDIQHFIIVWLSFAVLQRNKNHEFYNKKHHE